MNKLLILAFAALAVPAFAPSVAADVDAPTILPCSNPGNQGTIVTASYVIPSGTGWDPYPYYHVYGTRHYQNVNAYNYCVGSNQVGAVALTYGGSSSYDNCVNCKIAFDSNSEFALLP